MDESRNQRDVLVRSVHEFLSSLTTHDNSLSRRFAEAVDAFNAEKWQAVGDLLDDNVVLTTLDHPATIRGKDAVVKFLKKKIANDQPVLSPIEVNANSTTGAVKGTAFWTDRDNNVTTHRKITYQFIFSWHDNAKQWFVLNLSGSPD